MASVHAVVALSPDASDLGLYGSDGALGVKRHVLWVKQVVHKHVVLPHKKPHHYVTATLLTGLLKVVGHLSMEAAVVAYVYAFCETVVTGAEDRHKSEHKHWEQRHRAKRHKQQTVSPSPQAKTTNAQVSEREVAG